MSRAIKPLIIVGAVLLMCGYVSRSAEIANVEVTAFEKACADKGGESLDGRCLKEDVFIETK